MTTARTIQADPTHYPRVLKPESITYLPPNGILTERPLTAFATQHDHVTCVVTEQGTGTSIDTAARELRSALRKVWPHQGIRVIEYWPEEGPFPAHWHERYRKGDGSLGCRHLRLAALLAELGPELPGCPHEFTVTTPATLTRTRRDIAEEMHRRTTSNLVTALEHDLTHRIREHHPTAARLILDPGKWREENGREDDITLRAVVDEAGKLLHDDEGTHLPLPWAADAAGLITRIAELNDGSMSGEKICAASFDDTCALVAQPLTTAASHDAVPMCPDCPGVEE